MKRNAVRDVVVIVAAILIAYAAIRAPKWIDGYRAEARTMDPADARRRVDAIAGCIPAGGTVTVPTAAPYEVHLQANRDRPSPDYFNHLSLSYADGKLLHRDPLEAKPGQFHVMLETATFDKADAGKVLRVSDSEESCQ